MRINVKKISPLAKIPQKAHESDYCYDVYATSCEEVETGIWRYGLGLAFEPVRDGAVSGMDVSIDFRPRSSVWKTGLVLSNCVGTIDEGYRGEVMAYFYEVIPKREKYKVGDRIGQIKLGAAIPIEFVEADSLNGTERGTGGFGSTGE